MYGLRCPIRLVLAATTRRCCSIRSTDGPQRLSYCQCRPRTRPRFDSATSNSFNPSLALKSAETYACNTPTQRHRQPIRILKTRHWWLLIRAKCLSAWMRTLDARAVFYDRTVDPVVGIGGPRIYVFWHEYILLPLSWRGHCHVSMLISQHRDADMYRASRAHGIDCAQLVTRGGAKAIPRLNGGASSEHLTMTPDGRPRRRLAVGPVYLACRLQVPLVALGLGCDRPLRLRSWDRFALPRPFSRSRAVVGPPMVLPPRLNRSELVRCQQRTERLLNCLTDEAEAWAAAGSRKVGEIVMTPQTASPPRAHRRLTASQEAMKTSNAA